MLLCRPDRQRAHLPTAMQTALAFINGLGCASQHGGKWTPSIKRPVQTQLRGATHKSGFQTHWQGELQTAGKVTARADISAPNTCAAEAARASNELL